MVGVTLSTKVGSCARVVIITALNLPAISLWQVLAQLTWVLHHPQASAAWGRMSLEVSLIVWWVQSVGEWSTIHEAEKTKDHISLSQGKPLNHDHRHNENHTSSFWERKAWWCGFVLTTFLKRYLFSFQFKSIEMHKTRAFNLKSLTYFFHLQKNRHE